jgi:hypothetical protein
VIVYVIAVVSEFSSFLGKRLLVGGVKYLDPTPCHYELESQHPEFSTQGLIAQPLHLVPFVQHPLYVGPASFLPS